MTPCWLLPRERLLPPHFLQIEGSTAVASGEGVAERRKLQVGLGPLQMGLCFLKSYAAGCFFNLARMFPEQAKQAADHRLTN